MKKIVLLCAGGMSSSILVNRMKEAAKEEGYDCDIDAFAYEAVKKVAADADCVLIGPQIAYKKNDIMKTVTCPVQDISLSDYGMMNGKAVLQVAKELMGDA